MLLSFPVISDDENILLFYLPLQSGSPDSTGAQALFCTIVSSPYHKNRADRSLCIIRRQFVSDQLGLKLFLFNYLFKLRSTI